MEPKEVEKVFEPFVQLHPGTDKAQLGPGLGLTPVRNLVEMHGGRIVLKSAPGEGTTAFVRLPPARIAPRGADRKSVVSGQSVSVRLVPGGRRRIKKKTK